MSATIFRCSLSLPGDQAQWLAACAKRLGCSQSALVSVLLDEFLPPLSLGLGGVVDGDVVQRRMYGSSADAIREDVRLALREGSRMQQSDMFALDVSQ